MLFLNADAAARQKPVIMAGVAWSCPAAGRFVAICQRSFDLDQRVTGRGAP
jgi:hypothetical protein